MKTHQEIRDWFLEQQEDREHTHWHASSLGSCISGQWYERMGYKKTKEIDAKQLMIMKTGNAIETAELEPYHMLAKAGKIRIGTQEELVMESLGMMGHPDLLEYDYERITEIKSTNSRSFKYKSPVDADGNVVPEASDGHVLQTAFYMMAKGWDLGRIIYFSKDWSDMLEIPVTLTDELRSRIEGIAGTLNRALEENKAPTPPETLVYEPALTFNKWGGSKPSPAKWKVNWQATYCDYHIHCMGDEDRGEKAIKEAKQLNKDGVIPDES